MADIFSKKSRSEIMGKIKSSGNKSTELKLIKIFREASIKGWRRKAKLFGNPDFVFPKSRLAVFVDGCFWHGHNCRNLSPKQNSDYWGEKISRNKKRDRLVAKRLKEEGWSVVRIWECELKSGKKNAKLRKIEKACRLPD